MVHGKMSPAPDMKSRLTVLGCVAVQAAVRPVEPQPPRPAAVQPVVHQRMNVLEQHIGRGFQASQFLIQIIRAEQLPDVQERGFSRLRHAAIFRIVSLRCQWATAIWQ